MNSSQYSLVMASWMVLVSTIVCIAPAQCDGLSTDIHQYQIANSKVFANGDEAVVTQRARMLVDYQRLPSEDSGLEASSHTLPTRLNVTPQLLQYEDIRNRLRVNSFDKASSGSKLANILHQGMQLTQVFGQKPQLNINATDEWDAFVSPLRENQQAAIESLLSLFKHSPIVSDSLDARVGARAGDSIHLTLLPDTAWTVDNVTDSSITASLDNSRQVESFELITFGKIEFDRKTGWLSKLVLIEQKKRQNKTQTTRWVMAPRSIPYVSNMLWQDEPGINYSDNELYEIGKDPFSYQGFDESLSEAMMQLDKGLIMHGSQQEDITLRYIHGLTNHIYSTKVRYSNIRLFDWRGKRIELPFWQYSYHDADNFDGTVTSEVNLLPLLWTNAETRMKEKIERVDHITAEVSLTPILASHHSLSWDELLLNPYQYGDAKLSLASLDGDSSHYLLKIVNGQTNAIYPDLATLKGKMDFPNQAVLGPSWLSITEQDLLNELFPSGSPSQVIELILSERPEQLPILQTQQQQGRQITKTVMFVSQSSYEEDLRLAPVATDFYSVDLKNEQQKSDVPKSLGVISTDGHDLSIPIATVLTSICSPTIEQGFKDGDSPVEWHLQQINHANSAYVLTTTDDVRRYFYDKTISGQIICQGKPDWHDLPMTDNQSNHHTPWLVDVSAWLKASHFADMSSKLLPQYLNVWDINGQRLSIRLPVKSDELSVKQALIDGKRLSVNGAAASARYLTISDEPFTVPYQFHFQSLP
ncbi:hypothetical protein [Shewanella psychrotolerans]|uniref:hypothetical protein n=1 Tax=Shewanella psychrotolerans TaxID=2864206 RepID=UPI001C660A60|nr:hypothetical protein [Shewanella psychrotolerans]QYK02664.1 hypothetical protein K0I62_06895 [Shewanella psychrotolerans]